MTAPTMIQSTRGENWRDAAYMFDAGWKSDNDTYIGIVKFCGRKLQILSHAP